MGWKPPWEKRSPQPDPVPDPVSDLLRGLWIVASLAAAALLQQLYKSWRRNGPRRAMIARALQRSYGLPALAALFLGVSLMDLAGLGLIAPYIALVVKPEGLLEGRLGELLSSLSGPTDRETLLLGLSGLLVVLFLGKATAALVINNVIVGFAQNQQIR